MTSVAKAASRDLGNAGVFIDHTALVEDDLDWLRSVERLTLWDVSLPPDFIRRLPSLWWIDWRGGKPEQGFSQVQECTNLRYLAVNQIRSLSDLRFLEQMTSLEMLNLHGLPKVMSLPSLKSLTKLRRAQLGQMKMLSSIGPLLDAPNLRELQLLNVIKVLPEDVEAMRRHPALSAFEWFGENIPVKMWAPVRDAVGLPLTKAMHPEEWFGLPA